MPQEFAEKIKSYSLEDLNSIALNIDREKFPEKYDLVIERMEKLKQAGESLEVGIENEKRKSDAWRKAASDYFRFIVSLFLIGFSIYFFSESGTRKSDLSEVKGKIEVAYLDSTRQHRRYSITPRYSYNLTLQLKGVAGEYKYFSSDPGFWKAVRSAEIDKDLVLWVDKKNKIWEMHVDGIPLVSFNQNKDSVLKYALFTLAIGAIGLLSSYKRIWKQIQKRIFPT
jgi:hypothetical protein